MAYSATMLEKELLITNRLGLHARAAAKLVQILSSFQSRALLSANGKEINAKSIMGVLMLAAAQGTSVKLTLDGTDESTALAAVVALFERKFDEAD